MKRCLYVLFSCFFLVGLKAEDPIDSIVGSLDMYGLWANGIFYSPPLPESATPTQIIEDCIKKYGFGQGHIQKFKIVEVKKVKIPPDSNEEYNAALIDSDLGKKVFLFRYQKPMGWWTRIYDAK